MCKILTHFSYFRVKYNRIWIFLKNYFLSLNLIFLFYVFKNLISSLQFLLHGKKLFVTSTKLGKTNKSFVDRTKHFVVTNYFVIPILTNDFVGITKSFFPCIKKGLVKFVRCKVLVSSQS